MHQLERVLVVDDYPDTAEVLRMLLRYHGRDVRTARSGREAIAVAREFSPQVAIIDIGLPDLSGYDVAAELRQSTVHPIRLIALSGRPQEVGRKGSAFDHHLVKPVNAATLWGQCA